MTDDSGYRTASKADRAAEVLLKEYQELRPTYARFTLKLHALLVDLLQARSVDYHLVECRTKSEVSFREKATRASKSYAHPLQQITDLSGLRVITYYQDDADAIGSLITSEFSIGSSQTANNLMDPSDFGYNSSHYVVSLTPSRRKLLEWAGLADLKAEIQVRTVLQHAWAAISNKLQYKRELDVPIQLRRKLFRLSALFELADDEFVSLRNVSGKLTQSIEAKFTSGDSDIPIDHLSVSQFIDHSALVSDMSADAMEIGFNFDDSDVPSDYDNDSISDLVTLLTMAGLASIAELEMVLDAFKNNTMDYLRLQFAGSGGVWGVSEAFICQLLVIGSTQGKIRAGHLMRLGWDRGIAARVVDIARSFRNRRD